MTSIPPEKTHFKTISISGQTDVVANFESDTLTLKEGSNITLTTEDKTITIAASGGGGWGSTNAFSTIAVAGSSNIEADSSTDTLTFVAGEGISIANNAGTDTITITSNVEDTNTTYTAGDGLDITGTAFSTDLKASGGLVIESTELAVDLGASSITGTLAISDGGTGATEAGDAREALDVDNAGTDNSTDVTLANTNYLSLSGQVLTGGTVPLTSGGTGATEAGDAREALDVDKAGTDNSDVTKETNFGTAATDTIQLGINNQTLNLVASAFKIDSTSALKLNSSGSDISIGGDADDHNINIGTDGARIITIGNTVKDTRVHIQTTSKHGIHLDGGNTYDAYNKIIMHNLPTKADLDGSEPNGMLYQDGGNVMVIIDEEGGGDDY
jgi:hypothetical protein